MPDIVTDISINQNWNARKGANNPVTFTFTQNSAAFDISTYTFSVQLRKFGSDTNLLNLTQGSGITNNGAAGTLNVVFTSANLANLVANDYYWQMTVVHPDTFSYLWFQGTFNLYSETYTGDLTTAVTGTIDLNGTTINTAITLGGSGSSMTYPGAGIPLSTGSAWDTSITNNSSNWNTAFGWGNHASAGYLTSLSNGNGTTASGSAVNLGGELSSDVDIYSDALSYHRLRLGYYKPLSGFYLATTNGSQATIIDHTVGAYSRYYTTGSGGTDLNFRIGLTDGVSQYGWQFDANAPTSPNFRVPQDPTTQGWILKLGSDATGDTYYRNSSGYFTRLAAGTNGHVLTLASGIPSWAAPSGSGLTVGSSTITSGTNGNFLSNNSGVLGEITPGAGVATWFQTPSWTNFQSAITGTSPYWGLGANGTFTAPLTFTGSTTNTLQFDFGSLGTTYAGVFMVNNPTAAAAGAQQISPPVVRRGRGWKTNATAASQTVDFIDYVTPVQGAASPTGYWSMYSSINGGTLGEQLRVQNNGGVYLVGGGGVSPALYFGTGIDALITRGLSGTQGIELYGPASTANIYSLSISSFNSNNYTPTSGTGGMLRLPGNFTPSSGSANFYGVNATGTINMTGTSSGNVFVYGNNQTVTAAKGDYTGFYHNPTITSVTGVHYCFRATSGSMLIGGTTLTTNAILDLQSTSRAFIPPRMTAAQRDAIGTPSIGMVVYNTDTNVLNFYNGGAWGAV